MTPVQTVHQASNVIPVVAHPKFASNQFRDPGRGPHVGVVAVRQRSLEQQPQQTTPLGDLEFEWTSGREPDLQCVGASSPPSIAPAHHGTGDALDATSHLIERQARLQQRQRTPTPVRQEIRTTFRSWHRNLVPVFYSIAVLDLKIVKWCNAPHSSPLKFSRYFPAGFSDSCEGSMKRAG